MKFHFASVEVARNIIPLYLQLNPKYMLGSFFYIRQLAKKDREFNAYIDYIHSDKCKSFILDSGAFTLFTSQAGVRRWNDLKAGKLSMDEYVEDMNVYLQEYASFVKRHNIKYYIELDIDRIIGYDRVKKMTAALEKAVGWKSIPVFNNLYRNRQDLDEMLDNYDYIAIATFNSRKDKSIFKNIRGITRYANSKGVKVHGLALTGKKITEEIPEFYSIDSSSWQSGLRFGSIPVFDEKTNSMKYIRPKKRMKELKVEIRREIAAYSLEQWKKYQLYLDRQQLFNQGGNL